MKYCTTKLCVYLPECVVSLKRKCCYCGETFITGGSCQNDNFYCHQWPTFCQNDSYVSMTFPWLSADHDGHRRRVSWRFNLNPRQDRHARCHWIQPQQGHTRSDRYASRRIPREHVYDGGQGHYNACFRHRHAAGPQGTQTPIVTSWRRSAFCITGHLWGNPPVPGPKDIVCCYLLISRGHFYWHGLTLISAWISNHIPSKVWDEITYPFLNLNGATVEL